MVKKIIMLAIVAVGFTACGPSDSEIKAHENDREKAEKELEDSWADDMDEMFGDSTTVE